MELFNTSSVQVATIAAAFNVAQNGTSPNLAVDRKFIEFLRRFTMAYDVINASVVSGEKEAMMALARVEAEIKKLGGS